MNITLGKSFKTVIVNLLNEYPHCKIYAYQITDNYSKISLTESNIESYYWYWYRPIKIENLTDDEEMFLKLKYGN